MHRQCAPHHVSSGGFWRCASPQRVGHEATPWGVVAFGGGDDHRGTMRTRNLTTFFIYGLPIGLAALLLPALFVLLPSLWTQSRPASQASAPVAQAAPAPVLAVPAAVS